jgi:N-acetylmuramoyl-L-alanine amidase
MNRTAIITLGAVTIVVAVLTALIAIFGLRDVKKPKEVTVQASTVIETPIDIYETEPETEEVPVVTTTCDTSEPLFVEVTTEPDEALMSQKDIELIALVTMAEAEGESEYGKRLVIDTILNRMDSPYWPDTASGVIWEQDQFTSVWNGRLDRCYVRDDICQLVREELVSRTNNDVVFFRTGYFSTYGQPMFQEGNHYFSSSDY